MHKEHTHIDNIQILYEDNHIIVVNKRAGDIVQGDKTGDTPLVDIVKMYIKRKYEKPGAVFLGVVHRLDRPTSGIVIFARTSKALTRLNEALRHKSIQKIYWAIVQGKPSPPKNTLVHFLIKNPKNNRSKVTAKTTKNSKEAILHYKTLRHLDNFSCMEIQLETGRHHQIRVQLSHIGHPIKGDLKYGYKRSNKNGGIHLHAREIQFVHPVKKTPLILRADLPDDPLWNLCKKL